MKLNWTHRKLLYLLLFGDLLDSFESKMDLLQTLRSDDPDERAMQADVLESGYGLIEDLDISPREPGALYQYFRALVVGRTITLNDQGAIIESLASILQRPHARNTLSGKMLKSLRTAILTDTEQLGLAARLLRREWSCGQCGQDLTDGEMVTIRREPESTSIRCTRCSPPVLHACAAIDCDQKVDLKAKFRQMFTFLCPYHLSNGKKPKEGGSVIVDEVQRLGVVTVGATTTTFAVPSTVRRSLWGEPDAPPTPETTERPNDAVPGHDPRPGRAAAAERIRAGQIADPAAFRAFIEQVSGNRGPRNR